MNNLEAAFFMDNELYESCGYHCGPETTMA
jgi:hypothetical protein